MSQFVYVCPCGWRGLGVAQAGRGRRRSAVDRCKACGGVALERQSEAHPRVTHLCACGTTYVGFVGAVGCDKCRGRLVGERVWMTRRRKYVWTAERDALIVRRYDSHVKGRVGEISRALGFPGFIVKRRAMQLGVASRIVSRHIWTEQELAVLEEWTGSRSSRWIARRLQLTEQCVINKQKRLGMSRRVHGDGYTQGELELCFGVDHRVIAGWVKTGKLRATRRGTDRAFKQGDVWEFRDADVLAFVKAYPMAFPLARVDQAWFMGLVLGTSALTRAGAA